MLLYSERFLKIALCYNIYFPSIAQDFGSTQLNSFKIGIWYKRGNDKIIVLKSKQNTKSTIGHTQYYYVIKSFLTEKV